MPATESDRTSLLSSIAATMPFSVNSAAAGSCEDAERPRTNTLFLYGGWRRNLPREFDHPMHPEKSGTRVLHGSPGEGPSSGKKTTQAHQEQARLVQADMPQNFKRFIAR